MNYDEMSDFEINQLVARIATDGDVIELDDMFPGPSNAAVQVIYKVGIHGEFVDYCNNPSDAWPIIIENNISISPRNGKASLVGSYGACPHECEKGKELRTSMICFLEMKDAES